MGGQPPCRRRRPSVNWSSGSRASADSYRSDQYNEAQLREEFLNPLLRGPRLGRLQPQGLRRGLQGGHPRGRHQDRRPDQGPRLLLPRRRRHAELLRRGQEALGRYRRGGQPGLPAAALRLVGQAAGEHPDRLRGVCRLRLPHPAGEDRQGRRPPAIISCRYTEYLERWDELVALFSPEAIRRGSLEKLVACKKIKKGTAEVDAAFLEEIESWRDVLARNIALRNPGISHARPELRRAADHRPHRLPADLRGPRRSSPTARLQALTNGAEHLPPAGRVVPAGRRALQLGPVPLHAETGPRASRPTN